jgi:hypothetical protein
MFISFSLTSEAGQPSDSSGASPLLTQSINSGHFQAGMVGDFVNKGKLLLTVSLFVV